MKKHDNPADVDPSYKGNITNPEHVDPLIKGATFQKSGAY